LIHSYPIFHNELELDSLLNPSHPGSLLLLLLDLLSFHDQTSFPFFFEKRDEKFERKKIKEKFLFLSLRKNGFFTGIFRVKFKELGSITL